LEVLCNPEFLAEGTAMDDLLHPSRVIIGADSTPSGCKAAATLSSMYESWVPRARIITTNTWSSELSKLVANAMLAQRISSINSISAICEATGADIDEVAHSVGLDPRIGDKFLRAGIGFGGSCFKKDILSLSYLAEGLGLTEVSEYWQQVLSINEWQRKIFVRSVITCLNGTLRGKKVTLLGYAFKKDTADMRESPALDCIKTLLEEESAEIAIYDTCCNPKAIEEEIKASVGNEILDVYGGPIKIYADPYQACLDSYAVLIMTNSDEFRNTSTDTTIQNKFPVHDPRPFQHLDPTETEILALQSYLSFRFGTTDPLRRFNDEPACEEGCIECATVKAAGTLKTERLDWSRIAYHLQKPKWVFDGRGVLDVKEMEELGVRVRSIGKAFKSG
jgi:UDPglucose 6-dehydrogenase